MMDGSLRYWTKVPDGELEQRLEPVHDVQSNDLEGYRIMKDKYTGEHYLDYAYIHMQISSGGEKEVFHYLLPLESDDVLGIMFGDQEYTYPEHWRKPFLRNGPEGYYVWFDPAGTHETDEDKRIAEQIMEKLRSFKQSATVNPLQVEKLLNELDGIRNRKPSSGDSGDRT